MEQKTFKNNIFVELHVEKGEKEGKILKLVLKISVILFHVDKLAIDE